MSAAHQEIGSYIDQVTSTTYCEHIYLRLLEENLALDTRKARKTWSALRGYQGMSTFGK